MKEWLQNFDFKRIVIMLLFAFILGIGQYQDVFYSVDRYLMDNLYQTPTTPHSKIKIIKIDEKTLERFGPFGTWDRAVFASLTKKLNEHSPAIIAYDITFSGNIVSQGDQAFADECKKAGNVIIASNIHAKKKFVVDEMTFKSYIDPLYVEKIETPYDALAKVTTQGFSEAVFDKDGTIRYALKDIEYQGQYYPSFAYQVYQTYASLKGLDLYQPQLDEFRRFGISFSTKSGEYDEMSMVDVLDGKVDTRSLKDCIVLIGAHADGMQDAYSIPIERNRHMYGVEIHGNIIEALLTHESYLPVDHMSYAFDVSVICFIFMFLMRKRKILAGFVITVIATTIHVGVAYLLFAHGIEIPLVTLPIYFILLYIVSVIETYFEEMLRRQKIVDTFKRYVAPQVVEQALKKENLGHFEVGGVSRDIAVLFVDIRGFTSLSEKLQAHEVVDILNQYLNLTSSAIFQFGGTLDKFIGDATMAVFNSPFDLDDYVYRAVCTAYTIAKGSQDISDFAYEKFGIKVGFGIGIHCGKAVVGNIGSEFRMDFTAIGDTVNTASRIEGQAKSGQVLVSEEIVQRLKGRITVHEVGKVSLKGKAEPLMVYSVEEVDGLEVDL